MKTSKENIIMFPKWKEVLEKQSLQAMQDKRFADALEKLDQLLHHEINTHEILTGKVICLMELERYEEAEELCKQLIDLHNDHYQEYLHIYLTLLFQTNKYDELVDELDYIFSEGGLTEPVKGQLWQLYEISKKLSEDKKEDEAAFQVNELETALRDRDAVSQWRIISRAKDLPAGPHLEMLQGLLLDDDIHPVVKTAVVEWLQNQHIDQEMSIHKIESTFLFNPSSLQEMKKHPVTNQILILLREVEQENPTLYELLESLLFRYLYVRYPIMPDNSQLSAIAEALKWLAESYFSMDADNFNFENIEDEGTKYYINEIQWCEIKYFSILMD